MVNTRIGLAIFGASCLLAAGGGGYLASRHAAPAPQVAATAPATAGSSADASKPVQETEAVMDDHAAPPPVATPAAPAPAASTPRSAKTTTKAAATRESGTAARERGASQPTKPNPVPAPARAQAPAVPAPADTPPPTESRADATQPESGRTASCGDRPSRRACRTTEMAGRARCVGRLGHRPAVEEHGLE